MRTVSKKTGVSKKVARDRRILAKARREDAEKPVSEGIRLAAKRAGTPVDDAMAEISKAMDARGEALAVLDEVKALHELANLAERLFEGEGRGINLTRDELLGEALLCAREDIDLLSDGAASGCGIDGMHFVRAQNRIDLALKLADYREHFGSKAVSS